jgi:hypothetical protein
MVRGIDQHYDKPPSQFAAWNSSVPLCEGASMWPSLATHLITLLTGAKVPT